jgi:hypothetical protein
MQIRSFRGSGEPAWVNALSSACDRLGSDPRRALGPAATPAAPTGRTRDRTRPMLQNRQKALARAPSTRDPKRTFLRRVRYPGLVDFQTGGLNSELSSQFFNGVRFKHRRQRARNERGSSGASPTPPAAEKPWVAFMGPHLRVTDMPEEAQKRLGVYAPM